jgi:hypothetical protein
VVSTQSTTRYAGHVFFFFFFLIFVDQVCPAALLASMLKLIKIVIQVIHRSAWKITSQPVVKAMIRI